MQITQGILKAGPIAFLCVCSVFDIKKKEIPLVLILVGLILSFGISLEQIFEGNLSLAGICCSLLPGLFFLLTGFCTKEKIGYGDGLILLAIGPVLGFSQCFLGLCVSLMLSSIAALFLIVFRKAKKESSFAFIPFLTIGMGVSIFV